MLRTAAMVLVLSASAATAQIVVPPINGECPADHYLNSDGNCVEHPIPCSDRTGATAICNDGDCSYSQHHSGTCSRHGGVKEWLR
jgi:hypothetical protein